MKWYDPRSWFRDIKANNDAFVEVILDGGFGTVYASQPKEPKCSILRVVNTTKKELEEVLEGKQFNWNNIHSHWRHYLELHGFYAAELEDVKKYLRNV